MQFESIKGLVGRLARLLGRFATWALAALLGSLGASGAIRRVLGNTPRPAVPKQLMRTAHATEPNCKQHKK